MNKRGKVEFCRNKSWNQRLISQSIDLYINLLGKSSHYRMQSLFDSTPIVFDASLDSILFIFVVNRAFLFMHRRRMHFEETQIE